MKSYTSAIHLIPHYIGHWEGFRFSLVHFTHQVVFDYAQEKGGLDCLFPIEDMPQWYRARDTGTVNFSN